MSWHLFKHLGPAAILLGVTVPPTFGQTILQGGPHYPPPPCAVPEHPAPAPVTGTRPSTDQTPSTTETRPSDTTGFDVASLTSPASGAFPGATTSVPQGLGGYIDNAIPRTMFRLRFDAAYNDNRPDRAEFFYAKCGCFAGGPGPALAETRIDYQDVSGYLEVAANDWLSGFIEMPYRFLNPEANTNTNGVSDINAGFKAAFVHCQDQYLTFQFRTYIPTGDADRGLGTDHVSLEPALLAYQRLTDRLAVFGEFRDWIPIGGTDFAGNVLRYGVGASYDIYRCQNKYIAPVAELVGWTVLSGKEFDARQNNAQNNFGVFDASGDTIVNAKLGARVGFGDHSDIYAGYGRALTGQVWYKEILRLEYRLSF